MKTNVSARELRPYTMKELCQIYQISDKTMRKWLKPFAEEVGKRQGHIYNITQIGVIFSKLGLPGIIDN